MFVEDYHKGKLSLDVNNHLLQFDEVATTAFLPLGNTNFTRILNYGLFLLLCKTIQLLGTDAYLPTVYSASNLTNTPGVQNTAITILSSTGQIVYSFVFH